MDPLVTRIAAAVNTRTLYPASHPRVSQGVLQVISTLQNGLEESGGESTTCLIVGDDLVIEQEVQRQESLTHRQFVGMLKQRGIERLTLASGLEPDETGRLVTALATGEPFEGSPHIVVGRVHITLDDQEKKDDAKQREISMDQLEIVRDAFVRFRTVDALPMAQIEKLVWSFIESLSGTTSSMLPLARLKEHDEYTFVHCVNVSMLVLAQARSFGIEGAMLHAFGMAALLHDIGKLRVPVDVLNNPGKLEGDDWAWMQSHAEKGAWYLSEIEGTPALSIAVAYEHHFRYDGKPNYPIPSVPRSPNLATSMTSIADSFDAMQTVRPYQKPLMRVMALQVLRDRAGTFYDPVLVANFVRIVEGQAV